MEYFLTTKEKEFMDFIKLDYAFSRPQIYGDRQLSHTFSTHDDAHCYLLDEMMKEGQIPDDYKIYKLLREKNTFEACNLYTLYGDMIFQIDRARFKLFSASIFYCPDNPSIYQKLRLRLWHEYFLLRLCEYQISTQNCFYETKEEVETYLEGQGILDDEYILSLKQQISNEDA